MNAYQEFKTIGSRPVGPMGWIKSRVALATVRTSTCRGSYTGTL